MTEIGDVQRTSPEQGPLHYSVPIEEVLSAFQDTRILKRAISYERDSEAERQSESKLDAMIEERLWSLNDLFKKGLPSNGWLELHDLITMRDRNRDETTFSDEPKLELLADELQDSLLEYHTNRTAEVVALSDAFLEANPQLVHLGGEQGPFLRAIDAEFGDFKNEDDPTRLIAYDEAGNAEEVERGTRLYVNKAALPARLVRMIERHYKDMGL